MIHSTANMVPLKQVKPPSLLTLMLLGNSVFSFTDGCLRRSSSNTANQERPDMVERSTVSPSHKLPCMPVEAARTNCLNGGDCFAIPSYNGLRETGCTCRSSWEGRRCELAFIDPEILAIHQRNIRTAHIAAGVSVCILVFFFILVCVYVYIKKRKNLENSIVDTISATSTPTDTVPNNNNNNGIENDDVRTGTMCHENNNEESRERLINNKESDKGIEANGSSNGKASHKDRVSNA